MWGAAQAKQNGRPVHNNPLASTSVYLLFNPSRILNIFL